jgi:hypothetical protein
MHQAEDIDYNSGKPEIIEYYNKTKGGVDTLDQMCATYTTGRSTRRWPTAAFFCLLDIMAVNAYIVYKHFASRHTPEPNESKLRREFLHKLGEDLAMNHMVNRIDYNSISRDLRFIIMKIAKRKGVIQQKLNSLNNADNSEHKKRKILNNNQSRCYLCPRKANKMCRYRCSDCGELICQSKHMAMMCSNCANKDYFDND